MNREAVRKIIKKFNKKTSSVTQEIRDEIEGLRRGTSLDESQETERQIGDTVSALSDALAHIALKSRAHAGYISNATAAAGSPRPSRASPRPSRNSSNHGPSLAALDGIEVITDEPPIQGGFSTRECAVPCPCGLRWVSHFEIADWWSERSRRLMHLMGYAIGALTIGCMIWILVAMPTRLSRLSVIGVVASATTAVANGANDIANSVGTSVGAKALTLRQAVVFGLIAESLGAMTLGSLVAKTISKGVIAPETFAEQGCEGVLKFGVSMVCVLCGTGLTTLMATLYGLPISASHGVIGGLIAVGLVAQGPQSLGVKAITKTLIAWVASPVIGATSAAVIFWIILYAVHRSDNPAKRGQMLQPLFVAITVAVAAGFIVIKGPDALKITPVGVGAAAAVGIGVGVGFLTLITKFVGATSVGKAVKVSLVRSSTKMLHQMRGPASPLSVPPTATDKETEAAARLEYAEKPFVPLLILSALTVAFAHGANDVGNAVGPLAAVFEASENGAIAAKPQIPLWALSIGSAGFVVGIVTLGHRTISTVGGKITTLTPSKSFAVQIGAAVAVLSSTVLGLAVSTSHCLVGSVVGVGIASKISNAGGNLNGGMLAKIFIGWGVTIPLAMLVTVTFYAIIMPQYEYTSAQIEALQETGGACY